MSQLSKTLHTPVFFATTSKAGRKAETSVLASTTATTGIHMHPRRKTSRSATIYLETLAQQHLALQARPVTVPDSPESTASTESINEREKKAQERIQALQAKVAEAVVSADGNPSTPKWGHVVRLLRTGYSSGRYALGDTSDGRYKYKEVSSNRKKNKKKSEEFTALPDTEELEPQIQTHDRALQNEYNPQSKDALHAKVINWAVSVAEDGPVPPATQAYTNLTDSPAAKIKLSTSKAKEPGEETSKLGFSVVRSSLTSAKGLTKNGKERAPPPKKLSLHLDSETDISFLPPSFPEHLAQSTPRPEPRISKKRQVSPIPILSPNPTIVEPGIMFPASQDVQPLPPRKRRRSRDSASSRGSKRVKTSITAVSLKPESSNAVAGPSRVATVTPSRKALPTLTELLASNKRSPSKKKTFKTTTLARPEAEIYSHAPDDFDANEQDEIEEDVFEEKRSRAKSLSSLADSNDSEERLEKEREARELEMPPPAVVPSKRRGNFDSQEDDEHSQQRIFGGASQSQPYLGMGYNSQFDVNGASDAVAALLNDDLDYGAWVHDEIEEDEVNVRKSEIDSDDSD